MTTVITFIFAAWIFGFIMIVALSIRKHKKRKARAKAVEIAHLQELGSRQW